MRIYTIGIYEKALPPTLTWQEKLEIAKKSGYDFLEISIDETEEKLSRLNWSKEEKLKLVETMYKVKMPVRTMCLSGHRKYSLGSSDKMKAKYGLEIMERALQLADDLGIRIIQLAGYDVYYEKSNEETKERFQENLKKMVEMAASFGIIIGFETMETDFMDTVGKAMLHVKKNESPYLGIYPDCGNLTNAAFKYGKSVIDDLENGRGHIVAMHLKETKPEKYRDLLFGQGNVDFDKIIEKAWALGVRKYVTEFWYLGNRDWKSDIVTCNIAMRKILDGQK